MKSSLVPVGELSPDADAIRLVPPPQTGQSDIDAALARLIDLDQAAIAEHPARLAQIHQVLRAVLQETSAVGATHR